MTNERIRGTAKVGEIFKCRKLGKSGTDIMRR